VTTNDEIGDATIKVSVMMLIMMIMMMMMMMAMLVMMLEMRVMTVVTVCYAFTHSLGHTVTRSHGHWVIHSVTHTLIHSLIRSLTTYSYIPSFMHSVMSTADHQCEDSADQYRSVLSGDMVDVPGVISVINAVCYRPPCHTLTRSTLKAVHAD